MRARRLIPARLLDPFELDRFAGRSTGLSCAVWTRAAVRHRRCPRIWAECGPRLVPVSIREPVRPLARAALPEGHLEELRRFVRRNRVLLLAYWALRVDTVQLVRALRRADGTPMARLRR
jgi:hypothetical protein